MPASPKPDGLTTGEYVTLVVVLAAAIVGVAVFVTWAAEQRGLLAPGTTPVHSPAHPSMQPEATDGDPAAYDD
jgi:hypothetical protein